jgi:hypothetical protein
MLRKLIYQSTALVLITGIIFSLTIITDGQYSCLPAGSPVTINGSLTAADSLQTGRIVRDSVPSTCTGKTNSLQNTNQVRYDVQNFTNPTGQKACVTVDIDFSGCGFNDIEAVAYSFYDPANPATNIIGDLGFSTFQRGSFSFPVNAGASFSVVVHEITPNTGCANYTYKVSYSTNCRQPGFDRNNDGKAELSLYTQNGFWNTLNLTDNSTTSTNFGLGNDIPVTGDFSGDGKTDLTAFRPSEGVWYFLSTPNSTFSAAQWGANGDVPLSGDTDRDGKSDLIVFRPSTGVWYILRSATNTFSAYKWGSNGDKAVSGDFDGDLITDYSIYRPDQQGHGVWYIQNSNFDYGFFTIFQWGLPTDIPVPADYDGDAITDIAVYRPSEGIWYVFLSSSSDPNPFIYVRWGVNEDIPQPADYDGDGKADFAVYRPSSQTWYILGSAGGITVKPFGFPGDKPVTTKIN